MSTVTMRQMLDAGVHFGHQERYWHPKMAPYIFGSRHQIHIINLEHSLPLFREAQNVLGRIAMNRGKILFVGTKPAAQESIREEAQRCGMPFVDKRWLGGMLTNYKTIRQSIKRLRELETMRDDGSLERLTKKEGLMLLRELSKLEVSLSGIKDMGGLPDALFIIDIGHEKTAVAEAKRLGIPVIAIVDTNYNPNGIDYMVPGNDDSMRAIRLYCQGAADAILDAKQHIAEEMAAQMKEKGDEPAPEKPERHKQVIKKTVKKAAGEGAAQDKSAPQNRPKVVVKSAPAKKATAQTEAKKEESSSGDNT
ncbi:MAG: 30S ribosomal protein S2 [Gammaproteobacteria bacterium]